MNLPLPIKVSKLYLERFVEWSHGLSHPFYNLGQKFKEHFNVGIFHTLTIFPHCKL